MTSSAEQNRSLLRPLAGRVALVTGASRGIGLGIALQLGVAGATVYITGRAPDRSQSATQNDLPTLAAAAAAVNERGGRGIAVYCDHSQPDDVRRLFAQITDETGGQLDILVNNAFSAVSTISANIGKPFWECDPVTMWDDVNNVGLRNHYICSVYAARLMVPKRSGLIVNISSAGGLGYFLNVAYGIGKAGTDRMAADTAVELRKYNVTSVSLWPGAVRTELTGKMMEAGSVTIDTGKATFEHDTIKRMFDDGESPEFAGKAVVALASDTRVFSKTGSILIAADLGREYGFVDIDGRSPPTLRSINTMLKFYGYKRTASFVPRFIRLPGWLLTAVQSKL